MKKKKLTYAQATKQIEAFAKKAGIKIYKPPPANQANKAQLSKQLQALKNKAIPGDPFMVTLTQKLANELFSLRVVQRELEQGLVWHKAFEFIFGLEGEFSKVIQMDIKRNELLSGSHELAGFIVSGVKSAKMWISFVDPDMAFSYIDIGRGPIKR